jgi:hypothetical protein
MNMPCSVETLETTHPTTHHIPENLNPFFIDVFLMSECGDFPFWHSQRNTAKACLSASATSFSLHVAT